MAFASLFDEVAAAQPFLRLNLTLPVLGKKIRLLRVCSEFF
jgi:hypothetical protein